MAMKKAEMEDHRAEYHSLLSKAKAAQRDGRYREAIDAAMSSWDHIDGMMQYERRYEEKEFASIKSIDLVLKHAPLLLHFESLDRLETLLAELRRIEKNTSVSLADNLAEARERLWRAHCAWDHVERHPEVRQDFLRQALGGDQDEWRSMVEAWDNMGLIRRTPEGGSYRLALATRMDEAVSAKCSSCGAVGKAAKAVLLGKIECPRCQATVLFVLLPRPTPTAIKE